MLTYRDYCPVLSVHKRIVAVEVVKLGKLQQGEYTRPVYKDDNRTNYIYCTVNKPSNLCMLELSREH